MPLGHMSELWKLEEDHQDQREKQGLLEVQLIMAEEEVAMSDSSFTFSLSDLLLDSLEEMTSAGTPSPPQSSLGACPPQPLPWLPHHPMEPM